jgi:PKHD-type hydroxylase
MILTLEAILTSEELQLVVASLSQTEFIDGKVTAGWHAKLVKNNTQLKKSDELAQKLEKIVKKALERNLLLKTAILPKIIHSITFSRYEKGMFYGNHTDNAFMGKQNFWRSDVSFTLFLNDPTNYEGGELTIETMQGDRSYKLEAGAAIVYPSSFLHQVEPVTQGERLVAVGWIQCLVRDPAQREILFDLDTVRRSIFAKEGKTIEFDLLSKSHANLLRQWGE